MTTKSEPERRAKHVEITDAIDLLQDAANGIQEVLSRVRNEPVMEGKSKPGDRPSQESLVGVLNAAPKTIREISDRLCQLKTDLLSELF